MAVFQLTADTPEAKKAIRKYIRARRDADVAAYELAQAVFERDCLHTDMIEACLLPPDEMDAVE